MNSEIVMTVVYYIFGRSKCINEQYVLPPTNSVDGTSYPTVL